MKAIEVKTAIDCADTLFGDPILKMGVTAVLNSIPGFELVRCKDCQHWHEETGWCKFHSHFIDSYGEACHSWEGSEWKMFDANDFCSWGERKEEYE